jgi:hypothetical protein
MRARPPLLQPGGLPPLCTGMRSRPRASCMAALARPCLLGLHPRAATMPPFPSLRGQAPTSPLRWRLEAAVLSRFHRPRHMKAAALAARLLKPRSRAVADPCPSPRISPRWWPGCTRACTLPQRRLPRRTRRSAPLLRTPSGLAACVAAGTPTRRPPRRRVGLGVRAATRTVRRLPPLRAPMYQARWCL